MAITIMTGADSYNANKITKYALTLGGLNTTHEALKGWDPLMANYPRIFMVRKPISLVTYFSKEPEKLNAFKHMIEYGNLGVSGLGNISVEFDEIKGGYSGRSFEIPKMANDSTNELTIKLPELRCSPVREMLHTWINSVVDVDSGLLHYNGLIASGDLTYSQANHTAEFIYVSTDRTGMKVQYACHFTNCFPKEIPTDHFNGDDPSDHKHVEFDIKFSCCKREGFDVNQKAAMLLRGRQIMVNSLEYCTGLSDDIIGEMKGYNPRTGLLDDLRINNGVGTLNGDKNNEYRTAIDEAGKTGNRSQLISDADTYYYATPSFTEMGNKSKM